MKARVACRGDRFDDLGQGGFEELYLGYGYISVAENSTLKAMRTGYPV